MPSLKFDHLSKSISFDTICRDDQPSTEASNDQIDKVLGAEVHTLHQECY